MPDNEILAVLQGELGTLISSAAVIIIGLIIKDILSASAFGVMFYLDRNFNEGDVVYINGELATIIKISFTKSIFKMQNNSRWKYVHNSRIRYLDLEKVIEPENKKLEEKAWI